MTPAMLKENQFIISMDNDMTKIQIINPHQKGQFNDLLHMVLKQVITTGMESMPDMAGKPTNEPKMSEVSSESKADVESGPEDDKPMNRTELEEYHRQNNKSYFLKGSNTYRFLLNAKRAHEEARKVFEKAGVPFGPVDTVGYELVLRVLQIMETEAKEPYTKDISGTHGGTGEITLKEYVTKNIQGDNS